MDSRDALLHAQAALLGNPNDPSRVENEKVCLRIFYDLALDEEGFLKQKSRIQWLMLGDQNSNFFHKAVKARNSRNSINSIMLENGSRTENPETMKQEVVNHFRSVLGSNMQESATDTYHMGGLAWSS